MAEKSFPFDSYMTNGKPDRGYVADDFARYFRSFISSGIFLNASSNLQVVANGDMTVTLKPGKLIIDGYQYENDKALTITLEPADGVLDRIDRVCVSFSKEDRDIHSIVRSSDYAYDPIMPTCRRDEEWRDYVVADIRIRAGVISVDQTDITDQRLNSEVCGLAVPFVILDTSKLALQLQAHYDKTVENTTQWETDREKLIVDWFETIKGKLSEDAAVYLEMNKLDKTGEVSENCVAFVQAETRENIESGENQRTIMGKIKKWFTDLTAAAFAQTITSYPDLMANTVTGYLVDAVAVKEGFAALHDESGTLLWENPNIAATFAGQTIALDLADYRRLSVVFRLSTTIVEYIECTVRKGIKYSCNFPWISGDTLGAIMVQRYINFSNNGIGIGNTTYTSINQKPVTDNKYCIPLKIYGYKTD